MYLSIYLSIYLSVCLSVCLSVYVSTVLWIYDFYLDLRQELLYSLIRPVAKRQKPSPHEESTNPRYSGNKRTLVSTLTYVKFQIPFLSVHHKVNMKSKVRMVHRAELLRLLPQKTLTPGDAPSPSHRFAIHLSRVRRYDTDLGTDLCRVLLMVIHGILWDWNFRFNGMKSNEDLMKINADFMGFNEIWWDLMGFNGI